MIDPVSKGITQSQIIWIAIVFFLFLVVLILLFIAFGYVTKWFYRRRLLEEIRLVNEAQKCAKSGSTMAELQSKLITLIGQLQELNSKKDNACQVNQLTQFNQSLEKALQSTRQLEALNQRQPPMQSQAPMQNRAPIYQDQRPSQLFEKVPPKKDNTVVFVDIPDEPQPRQRPQPSKQKPRLYYVDEQSTSLESLSLNEGIKERGSKRSTRPKARSSTTTPTFVTPSKSNTTTPMTPTTPSKSSQAYSSGSRTLAKSPQETSEDEEVLFDEAKRSKGSKRQQYKNAHQEELDTDGVDDSFGLPPKRKVTPSCCDTSLTSNDIETDDEEVIIDDFLDSVLVDESKKGEVNRFIPRAITIGKPKTKNRKPLPKVNYSKPPKYRAPKKELGKTQSSPNERVVKVNEIQAPQKKKELVTDKTQSSPNNSQEAQKKPKDSNASVVTRKTDDTHLSSLNPYWRVVTEGSTDYNHIHSPNTGRLQQVVVKAHENTVWYPPSEGKDKRIKSQLANPFTLEPFIVPHRYCASVYNIRR